jgi:hypothetical protein
MAKNNFLGLISEDFKTIWRHSIEELINAFSTKCTLVYGTTKWLDCPDCNTTSAYANSAYIAGQPVPIYANTNCSTCGGTSKIKESETTENISLAILWDPSTWVVDLSVKKAENSIQTLSKIDNSLPKLQRCKELRVANDISEYIKFTFIRDSEICPIGMNNDERDFIAINWKRIS